MAESVILPAILGDGTGDVVGPSGATANALAAFDGSTGMLIKDSGVQISQVTDAFDDIATLQSAVTTVETDLNSLDTEVAALTTFQTVVPTEGGAVTANNATTVLIVAPGSALSAATINLAAAPTNKQRISITGSAFAVTAVTLGGNGNTVVGAITALAVGSFATYVYQSSNTTWYRIG